MVESPHITIDEEIMSGTPVFTGTRVPIRNLFDYLEAGKSFNEFLEDFPGVEKEQVVEILSNIKQQFIKPVKRKYENITR
jgi:uncharacterized protein (DUF433 family)